MRLRLLVAIALMAGTFFMFPSLHAHASSDITPEVVARIRARCVENQAALNRLHQTDAFLRSNRGNLYQTISGKLMVPMNRRLASNQLDGGALLSITSDYNAEYNRFFQAYVDYDNALSKVLDTDCDRQPVSFYTALIDAREKRIRLSQSNVKIKDYIRQYGATFAEFKTNFEKEKQ